MVGRRWRTAVALAVLGIKVHDEISAVAAVFGGTLVRGSSSIGEGGKAVFNLAAVWHWRGGCNDSWSVDLIALAVTKYGSGVVRDVVRDVLRDVLRDVNVVEPVVEADIGGGGLCCQVISLLRVLCSLLWLKIEEVTRLRDRREAYYVTHVQI